LPKEIKDKLISINHEDLGNQIPELTPENLNKFKSRIGNIIHITKGLSLACESALN